MSISKRAVSCILSALFVSCLLVNIAQAQTAAAPRTFYSDLESGPNAGGQSGQGAIVRVYGKGFGASQGSSVVTIGGVAAYKYFTWSDTQVAFQIANSAASGNIVVNVAGSNSNGVPFTVRSGHIYFVSTSGNDSQTGSYSKPWRTLTKAKNAMQPGDIVYAMNGVSATALDSSSASFGIARSGSNGNPIAIVAYPSATVTIGSSTGQTYGVRVPNYSYWVLAGLTLRGASEAVDMTGAANWRIVGNDISCPNGSGKAACVRASSSSQIRFLGNSVHDSGSTSSTIVSDYESVQFSNVNNVEAGWNHIGNTRSCRALLFDSNSTSNTYLSVHDNYIHDAVCDGVSFKNVDPSRGTVAAYNNVIRHVGTGPAPGGVEASYACISVSGSGQGSAYVLNNTLYDCGARANPDSGGLAASTPVLVSNNIFDLASGESYVTPNTSSNDLSGSNNLFYGAGTSPTAFSVSVDLDPLFADIGKGDFHLQSSSRAIDSGTNTGVATDFDGNPRPQGSAFDIGAFEFVGASQATGQLTEDVSSLDFGKVSVGSTSSKSVILSNTGNASLTISKVQINTAGSGFNASGVTLPATLAPGQSNTLNVTYAPIVAGTVVSSVTLVSSAANSTSAVQLTATAASTVPASPALSLSRAAVAAASTQTSSIWSTTTVPSVIDAGDAASVELGVKFKSDVSGSITGIRFYKSSANTGTHIGNLWSSSGTKLASATFTNETASGWQQVNFSTPVAITAGTVYTASYFTTKGHYSDNKSYFSTAGKDNPPLHALQNGGVFAYGAASSFPAQTWNASNYWVDVVFASGTPGAGTLSASATSLNFGKVAVGSSSTQNVTVTASTASVTISRATVTGAGFSISGLTLPVTIAAGQSATFQVKFAPTTASSLTGSLSLVSNASNTPAAIALTGTGATTTTSHSVALSWVKSTSGGVTGYDIYRGTTSGAYSKITGSAVSGVSYTDMSVTAGTTYYYVVTAVGSTGKESSYSNQAVASVPTP
jgi:hypothetical protein